MCKIFVIHVCYKIIVYFSDIFRVNIVKFTLFDRENTFDVAIEKPSFTCIW